MRSFLADQKGAVALIFGLALIPVLGLAGAALDYSRASELRNALQTKADAAALNAAVGGTAGNHGAVIADLVAEIQKAYGGGGAITDLAITGQWISETDFSVEAKGKIGTAMVHIMPGVEQGIDVSIVSVARLREQQLQYSPPVLSELDPEAGDYNQIYVYCFQPDKPGPKHARRKQMTAVADNAGSTFNYEWPTCGEGETLSFRLRNVRHVRTSPHLWNHPNSAEHNYYTDTTIVGGVERFDIGYDILETVRCDSREECKPTSQGGIIPEGKHRTPQIDDRPCAPGKYMYYGWEDRPPGQPGAANTWKDPAWTDTDYDDIRIIMACPEVTVVGERLVRLVK